MKISYDETKDILSFVFADTGITTRDLGEGFSAVYDADGRLARLAIHEAVARAAGQEIFRQIVIEGIGPFAVADPLIIIPRLFGDAELLD